MKRKAKARALILAAVLGSAVLLGGCARQTGAADPVAITVWHYYNGAQQVVFSCLVNEFNETVGAQQGIVVEPHSYGTIGDLTQQVKDAIYDKVGAEPLPDLFAAYADTAYEIDRLGMLADLGEYLTTEEQQAYIAAYLDEGRFDTGGFKIFPVAKSTELLSVNKTEWDAFSAATGASEADLATWEGIASLAERYYDWTDARTPDLSGDGKAFFGRDAFANYILIGSMQLGVELFSVEDGRITLQVDHDVMRRLWDNYYVPYVKGYYASYGKFRSDDLRTGDIAAYVGSTSGATYFPGEVTRADGSTYAIEGAVYPLPNFAGTQPMAVQQGAGMVVVKSTEERERAAVTFLKWLTAPEQNIAFALASGYLPVTRAANDVETLLQAAQDAEVEMTPVLRGTLEIGVEMSENYEFYTSRAFAQGYEARQVVGNSMSGRAKTDRAAVEEAMAQGVDRDTALAPFLEDACFEGWLAEFNRALAQAALS